MSDQSRQRYGPDPVVVPGTRREVEQYGDLEVQRGEWWLPPGAGETPLPTVVLVHGGFWRAGYDRSLEDAVAADLAGRGYLVWNLDYRDGAHPWPATLDDVGAGFSHVAEGRFAELVDLQRLAVVGHSAGGHLALWVAAQGGPRPVLAVGQAPVADLGRAFAERLGSDAVKALVGGGPEAEPARYALGDPLRLVPTGVRTLLIHGVADDAVPLNQSQSYLAAATAAGDACTLETYAGGHYEHLDPTSDAVRLLREALETM